MIARECAINRELATEIEEPYYKVAYWLFTVDCVFFKVSMVTKCFPFVASQCNIIRLILKKVEL